MAKEKPISSGGLSERKFKFCEAYLANGRHGINAARIAGYSDTSAWTLNMAAIRNLKDPKVKEYLSKRIKKMEKEFKLDLNYKLKKLKQVIDIGIPSEANALDTKQAKLAIAAIQAANKMTGDIAPTKNANINCDVGIDKFILEISNKALKEY